VQRPAARVDSLTPVPRPKRRNPWTSTGEVFVWVLFALLLLPAGITGYVIGHYTSLGKSASTVVHTVTIGTSQSTTSQSTTTSAATTGTTSATTTSSSGGGNAAAGEAVFKANGCAGCHTFKPAGATGQIGPNLDTAPTSDAKADNNMDLTAFVKQSIQDPDAYIAKGFSKGIMPTNFGTKLSPTELNDVVAFIVSGQS
jgi:cytochrome c551/c552